MDATDKSLNWLKNSTFKPCHVEEFSKDEDTKIVKELVNCSSSSSEDVPIKRSNKKPKRDKKINKKRIVKHYLNDIPSITDEKCEFRKYNFLEHMPKEDRSQNFFIDLKGNSQISRYGCIYEKHVSKYRLRVDAINQKPKLSERYFEKLKGQKSIENTGISIEKRLCDSRCICHQSFIPIPFDICYPKDTPQSNKIDDELGIHQSTILNEAVKKDPHNIEAWVKLVQMQSEHTSFDYSKSSTNSIIIEKKLMILERAISKNQSNLKLHLMRMALGIDIWVPDKLQKEWSHLIFVHNTNIDVWRFYIAQMSRQLIGFSVEKVINVYTKCFNTFFNIMSGRMKIKTIDPETIYELCDLFADYCDYLAQSGYTERAFASWQAMIEYNFFSPLNLQPKSSGNLLDDPMLQSFQEFWKSPTPLFGHQYARGWAESIKSGIFSSCSGEVSSLQQALQQSVSDVENSMIDDNDDESEMWLKLEKVRLESWWVPYTAANSDQEDPDRYVPFSLVQPALITLHNPQNLSVDCSPPVVSAKAKKQLLLLFFEFLGVSYPQLSIQNELCIHRIRWHQMQQIDSIKNIIAPLRIPRDKLLDFVQCCFKQLLNVLDDDWKDTISVLELAYIFQTNLSCESWKQALSSIKNQAKTILASHSNSTWLWSTYASLLIDLMHHDLFSKGRVVLINEASKVLKLLVQQITSSSLSPGQQLTIFLLFIDLITKRNSSESTNDLFMEITKTLWLAGDILVVHYCLSLTVTRGSPSDLVQIFTETVNLMGASSELLVPHWYQAVLFQLFSQILYLDSEKFKEWVIDDCLLTITSMGSSCLWSQQFLYQLSEFLETATSFIGWYYRSKSRNECAILRSLLTPIVQVLVQIQSGIKKPILEMVISPRVVHNCIGYSMDSQAQRFNLRNFLWNLVASFETESESRYQQNCQASSILLLSMEINRLESLAATDIYTNLALFSGRTDRVRSTISRLINLQCMHWKYRLVMWHAFLKLEATQESLKRNERTMGVFYRAITEMPGQKSLYMATISEIPTIFSEVTMLMKDNHVRTCVPVEEVKLLLRIRQSRLSINEPIQFVQ